MRDVTLKYIYALYMHDYTRVFYSMIVYSIVLYAPMIVICKGWLAGVTSRLYKTGLFT
jgi:hypothetical protein